MPSKNGCRACPLRYWRGIHRNQCLLTLQVCDMGAPEFVRGSQETVMTTGSRALVEHILMCAAPSNSV